MVYSCNINYVNGIGTKHSRELIMYLLEGKKEIHAGLRKENKGKLYL